CCNCAHSDPMCAKCICNQHMQLPFHRFQRCNGSFYAQVDSKELGYQFFLGHNGNPCNKGVTCDFVLGNITGLHSLRVHFCAHRGAGDAASQLLQAKIFPCSDKIPASGFTFRMLRQLHHLSLGCMLSSPGYWDVLVSKTNSLFPEHAPKRYRDFMRVTRQWQLLMDLRRAGQVIGTSPNRILGDLSLRCPACHN
ncbi:hypothetical protein BDV93DRAFT_451116, partial [Ceratobasidium sp. AG-I]